MYKTSVSIFAYIWLKICTSIYRSTLSDDFLSKVAILQHRFLPVSVTVEINVHELHQIQSQPLRSPYQVTKSQGEINVRMI